MTKRIFHAIFWVAAAILAACSVLVTGVLYGYFSAYQQNSLAQQAALAAKGVESAGAAYFDGLDAGDIRLTWIAADGTVIYDSRANASEMENHGSREEVREALESGTGESSRRSTTLGEDTLYRAVLLTDGTVLRVSVTKYTSFMLMMGAMQPMILLLLAAIAVSAVLARRISAKIVRPLNSLDLEHPLENDVYDELSPLLVSLERQHRQINSQLELLKKRHDEFSAVTENMSEGLVLLGGDGRVLSINPAATRLFGTDEDCVGMDILSLDRRLAMQQLVERAESGTRCETMMELAGGKYQVDASPVVSDGKVSGVCLLAFDVTEKALAERQRREFSANVSHELKTPLQTIMGSAELIENGLVKDEDLPLFAGRIRGESARLVSLIDDIIRLSELDESGALANEEVALLTAAKDAAALLEPAAQARGVTIEVSGEELMATGARRLVNEIIYNLCDNAIKYNVQGGRVEIKVAPRDGGALLTVADTGIGIPKEAQGRVFERFYRVDKSRSKETGGTGLGLSIVKHAAQRLGAEVSLESEPGRGSCFSVFFPPAGVPRAETGIDPEVIDPAI